MDISKFTNLIHWQTGLNAALNVNLETQVWPATLALFSFVVLSGLQTGFAQDGIHFRHLTVKDGLSQGTVITIFQDTQGFMWFGTQDVLNRYDGYSFRVFKHDPSDTTTINDNFIVLIAEDTAGSLWVGTREHPELLSRFDAVTESFTHWAEESISKTGWRISAARRHTSIRTAFGGPEPSAAVSPASTSARVSQRCFGMIPRTHEA